MFGKEESNKVIQILRDMVEKVQNIQENFDDLLSTCDEGVSAQDLNKPESGVSKSSNQLISINKKDTPDPAKKVHTEDVVISGEVDFHQNLLSSLKSHFRKSTQTFFAGGNLVLTSNKYLSAKLVQKVKNLKIKGVMP